MPTKSSRPNAKQLFAAINRRDAKAVGKLVDQGADLNSAQSSSYMGNHTALMLAAGCQFPEGVELLLRAGADVNARTTAGEGAAGGMTALHWAIDGSDSNSTDPTDPSGRLKRLKMVKLLIEAGADVNAVFDKEETPLSHAASAGEDEIVRVLVEHGAELRDALGWAATGGNDNIIRYLIERGTPVDGVSKDEFTPLMTAAYRGHEKTVDLLLKHGAQTNRKAQDGRTPPLCAALYARDAATKSQQNVAARLLTKLVEARADLSAKDENGRTAFDYVSNADLPYAPELLDELKPIQSE